MPSSRFKLNEFRRDGKYCDIVIRLQNKTTKCHRAVIASVSEVLDCMFCSTFREKDAEEVSLQEIDPLAFECILEFAYLDQEPDFFKPTNNVFAVLKACDFLRVLDLVELCINHIIKYASSMENLCEIFVFSCISNYSRLSNGLLSYFAENFYLFSQDKEFLLFPYEQLKILVKLKQSLDEAIFKDEDLLLDAIIRWILHMFEERKNHFLELISIVNIDNISSNYREFLSNKYKMNLDLKSCLIAFFTSETNSTPRVVMFKSPMKNSALHVYIEFKGGRSHKQMNVLSLSKFHKKDQWSISELNVEGCCVLETATYNIVSLDEPYNNLYSLSLQDLSFSSYSSVSLNEKKTLKVPHLECTRSSKMCGFQNNTIYLYDDRNPVLNYYKCEIDEWYAVPKLKRAVMGASMVTDSQLLYLIGGENLEDYRFCLQYYPKYVQAFDHRVSEWLQLTGLGTSCDQTFYGRCCLNEKIYSTDTKKIEMFDITAKKWAILSWNNDAQNVAPSETPIQMVPFENNLWIFYYDSMIVPKLIVFDPTALKWYSYQSYSDSILSIKKHLSDDATGKQLQYKPFMNEKIRNVVTFKPLDGNIT